MYKSFLAVFAPLLLLNVVYPFFQQTSNEPRLSDQWGLDNTRQDNNEILDIDIDLDATEAWAIEKSYASFSIALIDQEFVVHYDIPYYTQDLALNSWNVIYST